MQLQFALVSVCFASHKSVSTNQLSEVATQNFTLYSQQTNNDSYYTRKLSANYMIVLMASPDYHDVYKTRLTFKW